MFLIEVFLIQKIFSLMNRSKMENSCRCDVCNNEVHRASYVKHLRSKKHLENEKQNEMIIPEWLFKEEQAPNKKNWKINKIPKQ